MPSRRGLRLYPVNLMRFVPPKGLVHGLEQQGGSARIVARRQGAEPKNRPKVREIGIT